MHKNPLMIILVVIIGIVVALFASFYIDLYGSLDKFQRIYLSEVFAAIVAIIIFVIKKKTKTDRLDRYEILMIIFMGGIAAFGLIPEDSFEPTWLIGGSIMILVAWFIFFGLNEYLDSDGKMDTMEFLQMLFIFIGFAAIIMVAFNIHRVTQLFSPDLP